MQRKPILVTVPSLPPLEDFVPYLAGIWERKWLTNGGPLHAQFEEALAQFLDVPYVSLFNNGETALLVALKALDLSGEVVTTPYSFVGTTHALLWANLTPVFADVDPKTYNLDPVAAARAISPATTAILPVHCYGTPADTASLQQVGASSNVPIIYDAAHAFGVTVDGQSVLNEGELSVLSFHATKVFNTFEGGAVICQTPAMKARVDALKNFGITDEVTVVEAGINGKMSEFQSALGLLQLQHIPQITSAREKISMQYDSILDSIPGIGLQSVPNNTGRNFGYYPIMVDEAYPLTRDDLFGRLRERNVFARRYFYPLISSMPMYRDLPSALPANLPVSNRLANSVICLPIYPGLSTDDVAFVGDIIANP